MTDTNTGLKNADFARVNILGVLVSDVYLDQAAKRVIFLAKPQNRGKYVVTVNPEFVMMAHRNRKFANILAGSDLAVADGIGVTISKLILGGREHGRVTGVELLEKVCQMASDKAVGIGFLGGFAGVAAEVAKRQAQKYPGLKIVVAKPGVPTISYDSRLNEHFAKIGRVDVLFVAYGMGQQEFWISRNRKKLNVGVMVGVGGAFDYLAGVKKRAPVFLQNLGLEWLWRLINDPARIWRMRVLPIFAFLVFWQFLKKRFFGKIPV